MSAVRYTRAIRAVLDHLETTQTAAIERAAELVVGSVRGGGAVFVSDIGHGTQGDFLNRAGGLACVQHFTFSASVTDTVASALADRPRKEAVDRELGLIRLAVRTSNLRPGDTLLLGSVSGRNVRPVGLALECADFGVHTVAFTSMEYTQKVTSLHPSGKRLFEAAEVTVDIGAPFGDAAVEIPGVEIKVLPVSGVAMDVAGWMIWERVMETMAAAGDPLTVFQSVNREGGQEYYKAAVERFNKRGY